MRFLGLLKADKDSESGAPPSPELMARMGVFIEEVTKAGVVKQTEALYPSSRATRIKAANGKITVTDGPFAETKELVASYAMIEAMTKEEALKWTKRFLEVLGEGECIVYQIMDEPPDSRQQ